MVIDNEVPGQKACKCIGHAPVPDRSGTNSRASFFITIDACINSRFDSFFFFSSRSIGRKRILKVALE